VIRTGNLPNCKAKLTYLCQIQTGNSSFPLGKTQLLGLDQVYMTSPEADHYLFLIFLCYTKSSSKTVAFPEAKPHFWTWTRYRLKFLVMSHTEFLFQQA